MFGVSFANWLGSRSRFVTSRDRVSPAEGHTAVDFKLRQSVNSIVPRSWAALIVAVVSWAEKEKPYVALPASEAHQVSSS
jgi:hypothetical protein